VAEELSRDVVAYCAMKRGSSDSSLLLPKAQCTQGACISGTTAVAVLVTPEWILCANLGDSRASLLLSKNEDGTKSMIHEQQTIVALSKDHKPDLPKEEARIEAANGSVIGGRVDRELAVSRALGDFDFKETYPRQLYDCDCESSSSSVTKRQSRRRQARLQGDESKNGIDEKSDGAKEEDLDWEHQRTMAQLLKVSPFPEVFAYPRGKLQHEGNGKEERLDGPNGGEKILLLGCDGIWDVMTNENCHNLVQELLVEGERNIGSVAEEILDRCLKKESKDNMTMIVVHFSDAVNCGGSQTTTSGGGILKR
jgi:serine/threonine protein phosphatase PrpC